MKKIIIGLLLCAIGHNNIFAVESEEILVFNGVNKDGSRARCDLGVLETKTNEQLRRIEKLTMAMCSIRKFPTCIEHMMHLTYLDLSGNFIKSLEGMPTEMPNLQYLNLGGNHFKSLRGFSKKVPALKELNLEQAEITSPEGLPTDMPELHTLKFWGSRLETLNGLPSSTPKLKMLNIGFTDVPEEEIAAFKKEHLAVSLESDQEE